MFWRVFFLGETLVDVATLNNQLPWGYSAGPSDYPYNRRDLTDMYITREYFVIAAYGDGEFPLWNPYTMAGHPIYADGVTRTLSPFLLFYKFFDVPLGYSLARITELMLAAVFMYIFLIAIGASARGALAGALVFELSAHSMLHLTGLGWWGGLMWLPLIFLFADRAVTRRSYAQAAIAGLMVAAQFFCGYMPNQIYYVGAIAVYYLFFAFIKRSDESRSQSLKRGLAMMVVTLGVGLALAATQWVPTLELLRQSNRKIVGAELGYIYLPPWYAATLVFPNLFGSAYDVTTLTLFTALGVSHDHILYLGVAALIPVGFALYSIKSSRRLRLKSFAASPHHRVSIFALLAAAALVVMMAAPLYIPLTRFIPILNVIRVAVRAGVVFLFAASTLVAFGTDSLLKASGEQIAKVARAARWLLIAAILFIIICAGASYLMRATGLAAETGERGRMAFIRRAAFVLSEQFLPPDASLLIPIGLLSLTVLLLWLLSKEKITRAGFFAGFVALLVIDLFWASGQFNQTFDRSRVYPQTQITNLLQSLPPGRALVVPAALETNRRVTDQKIIAPPNTLLPYRIPTVAGKNQQFPRWYREYASLIEPQPNLSHVVFNTAQSPFFDALNVRYVMTYENTPLAGYKPIATAEGVSIYENPNALPRAFFANRVIEVSTPDESLSAMRDPIFDPHTDVVVETMSQGLDGGEQERDGNRPETGSGSRFQGGMIPSLTPVISEDKRNRVVIETENQSDGVLVLSDNYYPGWQATIDGTPVEILRANHTMRAVRVPAGRHVVSFVFAPTSLTRSAYASIAAAALLLAAFVLSLFKRRRRISREVNSHDIR